LSRALCQEGVSVIFYLSWSLSRIFTYLHSANIHTQHIKQTTNNIYIAAARVETVRDIGISQPRQKPWADKWGIRSGSGEAREPIGRRGRARHGLEGQGQQATLLPILPTAMQGPSNGPRLPTVPPQGTIIIGKLGLGNKERMLANFPL
jgi:hypothetical protein